MTTENLDRGLRAFCRRRPFQDFLIEFHSGDRLQINHPEAVARFHDFLVFRSPQSRYRIFDSSSVNQLLDL
jgi:hypothetical protein